MIDRCVGDSRRKPKDWPKKFDQKWVHGTRVISTRLHWRRTREPGFAGQTNLPALANSRNSRHFSQGRSPACTFQVMGRSVIVYSPLASYGRTQSDLAHEVSHIILGHQVQTIQQLDGISFFTCDPDEEQEANWLAGCLLLPRKLLLQAVSRGLSARDIAKEYGVSSSMAEFRIRATGVSRQLRAARRFSSR